MISSKRYGYKVRLYTLADGDISYYAVYKNHNNQIVYKKIGRKSEGVTEKKAFELRNKIVSEIKHGVNMSERSVRTLRFEHLAEKYFEENTLYSKSILKYKLNYNRHIAPVLKKIAIKELKDDAIYKFQFQKQVEGLADSSINNLVKLIIRIINYSIKKEVISHTPFKNIKLLQVSNTRTRYLSEDEIIKLKEKVKNDKRVAMFITLALMTGARAGGILNIKKADINLKDKTIKIYDFKTETEYVAFIREEDMKSIEEYIHLLGEDDFIIGLKYNNIYKKLRPILKEFNLTSDKKNDVVIHTMRHTIASHLINNNVSEEKIQKILNQKTSAQTRQYAKLSHDSGYKEIQQLYKGDK